MMCYIEIDEEMMSIQYLMQSLKDLLDIKPQIKKVWNCVDVGLEPNVRC